MARPISNNLFSSNVGIESITRQTTAETRLPESTQVMPSAESATAASNTVEMLYSPKLEAALSAFLQNEIGSRELLIPGVFNSRLRKAMTDFRKASRKKKSRSLRDAAQLLEEDEDLKSLLSTYRALLQKG